MRKAGPLDVSAKIVSQQMKRAEYDRTYNSREHVKERDAENKRNTRHSTKTAWQAAPEKSGSTARKLESSARILAIKH